MTVTAGQDIVDVAQDLLKRVNVLEQRITSPNYTVPNGSSPTFGNIGVGGGTVILATISSSPTSLVLTPGATFEDIYVTASWTAPVDNTAIEYEVQFYFKDPLTSAYTLARTGRTYGLSLTIGGLQPNATYGVVVRGVNRIGITSAPLPAVGYTDVTTGQDATIPAAPTGLTAAAGTSSITVYWNDNTEPDVAGGAGLYRIQRATNAAFTTGLEENITSATIIAFTDLVAGTMYYFRVLAIDSSGNEGPYTGSVNIAAGSAGTATLSDGVAPTTSPAATVRGATGLLLVQFPVLTSPDPITYEVHVSTTSGFTPGAGTLSGETAATNFMIRTLPDGTALAYGTTYYVKIIAKDRDGSAPEGTQGSGQMVKAGTNDLAVGSITAASGIIGSLDASTITTGTMSASFITAGTITSDRIHTAGLDAAHIKFGTMDGDRIQTNTLDVSALLTTSTLTSQTIIVGSGGQIKIGNPGVAGYFGVLLDPTGIRAYQGTTETIRISALDGTGTFYGTVNATGGTFTGTITGGTFVGGTFKTNTSGRRVEMSSLYTQGIRFYGDVSPNNHAGYDWSSIYMHNKITAVSGGGTYYGTSLTIDGGHWAVGDTAYSNQIQIHQVDSRWYDGIDILTDPAGLTIGRYGAQHVGHVQIGDNLSLDSYNSVLTNAHVYANSANNMRLGVDTTLYVQGYWDGSTYRQIFASAFTVPSTSASKKNIKKHPHGLSKIKQLKPIQFDRDNDQRRLGVVAEEIADLIPEVATYHSEDPDEAAAFGFEPGALFGVDMMGLLSVLIASVQELSAEVDDLKNAA